MKLILASASPRRREILNMVGLKFDILPTDADETTNLPSKPDELVTELAHRKAVAAFEQTNTADAVIIAADTVVWHDGEVLTKPTDKNDAERMLSSLSDSIHYVYSGLCVKQGNKEITAHVSTAVKMRKLSKDEISAYVATGEPLDKAGAYGIQELGGMLVEKIDGDYYNVVGLPLVTLCKILKESFGYDVLLKR